MSMAKLLRLYAIAALAVLLVGVRAEAGIFNFSFEFSGTDFFLLVDGNGDGPGPGDCRYRILLSSVDPFSFPSIKIEAVQDANTPLNMCSGEYIGDLGLGSDSSSEFAEVDIDSTNMNSGGAAPPPQQPLAGLRYFPPMEVELIDEFNGPPDGFPMSITEVVVTGGNDQLLFSMRPCSDGGPSLEIKAAGGTSVLVELEQYPDSTNPTHLKMSGLPFELAAPGLGTQVSRDAYFPIANRALTGKVAGTNTEVLDASIDGLQPCGRTSAPTASQWTLIALMVGLLAVGTAGLGRWRGFYQSLPRV